MNKKMILKFCLILSIIFLIISILLPTDAKNIFYHIKGNKNSYKLNDGDVFSEEYISNVDNLNGIGILFANENSKKCTIDVSLLKNNDVIFNEKISNEKIKNDQYQVFEFNKIANSNGQKFKLNIKNNCSNSISLFFYKSDETNLLYNNDKINYGIFFYEIGVEKSYKNIGYASVIFIIILIPVVMEHNFNRKGGKGKNVKKKY